MASDSSPSKLQRGVVLAVSVLLTLAFIGSGGSKLAGVPEMVQNFARWGFPGWFIYLIGVLEVLGAVGLWVRPVRAFASLGLGGVMIGAALTHLTHGEAAKAFAPLVLLGLTAFLTYARRAELPLMARHVPAPHAR
jgi:uncharacterized membrane protein YphA (DoxX/SURF4 family)